MTSGPRMEGVDPSTVPLFLDMPWFSPFVSYATDRLSLLPEDLRSMATNLLSDVDKGCREDAYKDVAFNRTALVPTRKSAAPVVSHLFALRLLDIASRIQVQDRQVPEKVMEDASTCLNRVVPRTAVVGETQKLRGLPAIADGRGWPNVIANVRDILKSKSVKPALLQASKVNAPSDKGLAFVGYALLQGLSTDSDGRSLSKIVQNIHAAAFCVNYALQGYSDLPSTFSELYKGVTSGKRSDGRYPQLVVSCSVQIVLSYYFGVDVIQFFASRLLCLEDAFPVQDTAAFATGSGDNTPLTVSRLLADVHQHNKVVHPEGVVSLWNVPAAYFIEVGIKPMAETDFISEAELLLPLAFKEQSFFETDVGVIVDLPLGLSYERVTAKITHSDKEDSENSQNDIIPSESTGSRFSSGKTRGVGIFLASEPPRVDTIQGGPPSHRRSSRIGSWRRKDTVLLKESNIRESNIGGRLCEYSEPPSNLAHAVFGEAIRKATRGQAYIIVGLDGRREVFWPTCPVGKDLILCCGKLILVYKTSDGVSYLVGLLDRSNLYQTIHGNGLLFYKLTLGFPAPDEEQQFATSDRGLSIRGVVAFSAGEYEHLDSAAVLPELLRGHVLVAFSRQRQASGRSLDTNLLSRIGPTSMPRRAFMDTRPYPITADADATCSATFSDFLALLSSPGLQRIMSFPLVPSAASSTGTLSISSNVFSRQYISRLQAQVVASALPPNGWHFIATANAVRNGMLLPDGLNTELTVWEGCVIVFAALPVEDPSFLGKISTLCVPPADLLAKIRAVTAILLFPGDRVCLPAGTPYDIVTLKDSVCHATCFLCFATMEQTLWADLYIRMHPPKARFRYEFDRATALTDIAFHWHDVIVNDTHAFLALRTQQGHRTAILRLREVINTLDDAIVAVSTASTIRISVSALWSAYLVQQGSIITDIIRQRLHIDSSWREAKDLFWDELKGEKGSLELIQAVVEGSSVHMELALPPHTLSFVLTLADCTSMSWALKPLLDSGYTFVSSM
ncbi:hypothetical protein VNI00_018090 [Paramarasmius palmivorus]|uniref:Anaphase-promoting complex subunit 1 n=1 Tax=Paramarasmius palmivorus TaxID=297713 RepID=A0AAW0B157_9AGAR